MKKIWLIIKREYLTRVMNKSFLLITLLTPLGFIGIVAISVFFSSGSTSDKKVVILDDSGLFRDITFPDSKEQKVYFDFPKTKSTSYPLNKPTHDGILIIPENFDINNPLRNPVVFISEQKAGLFLREFMKNTLNEKTRELRFRKSGLTNEAIAELDKEVPITFQQLNNTTETEGKTEVAAGIGYVVGFTIYLSIILFGSLIAKSVSEEKTGRIVEVIISSVKPFQLMLGKIFGVGMVGITQLLIWVVLLFILSFAFGLGGVFVGQDQNIQLASSMSKDIDLGGVQDIAKAMNEISFKSIIAVFVLFYFFGFMLYGSLFAALGSLAGEENENNPALSMLVTLPIMIAFFMMMNALADPDGSVAWAGSLIPFTSPIILPALMAFDLPLWRIGLSLIILIISVIFFVYVSGKIYRTGILMYGKKVSLLEVGKWIFRKD